MDCPSCREPLEAEKWGLYEDIPVGRCAGCGSLWMSAESLDRLDDNISVNAAHADWISDPGVSELPCPECAGSYRTASADLEPIRLESRPEVSFHRCSTCRGFFLANDMLDALRKALAARR